MATWGHVLFFVVLFLFLYCKGDNAFTHSSLIVGRNGRVKKMMGGSRKCNWYDFVHDELL